MAPLLTHLRPAPGDLATEEDEPVDDEEDRGGEGLCEKDAELVLEQQPCDARRNRRHDEEPSQPLGRRRYGAGPDRVHQARNDGRPVAPEEGDEGERRAHVQGHDEGEPERLGLALGGDQVVPTEQRREDHRVAEARDREELAHALKDPEHDRLRVGDLGLLGRAMGCAGPRQRQKVSDEVEACDQHGRQPIWHEESR